MWYARFLGGIETEGGGGFGRTTDAGGAAMTVSIGTNVVSKEVSVRGKITKYQLAQYV